MFLEYCFPIEYLNANIYFFIKVYNEPFCNLNCINGLTLEKFKLEHFLNKLWTKAANANMHDKTVLDSSLTHTTQLKVRVTIFFTPLNWHGIKLVPPLCAFLSLSMSPFLLGISLCVVLPTKSIVGVSAMWVCHKVYSTLDIKLLG